MLEIFVMQFLLDKNDKPIKFQKLIQCNKNHMTYKYSMAICLNRTYNVTLTGGEAVQFTNVTKTEEKILKTDKTSKKKNPNE